MKSYFDAFIHMIEELFAKARRSLSNNLGWKVFSLILAIITWFAVINITNPKEIWPFSIRLTLADLEQLTESKNVVVQNQDTLENTTVSVKIRGNRLDLEKLSRARAGMSATANLGVIYDFSLESAVQAPIDITFPTLSEVSSDAFEVVAISPKYAEVLLEGIVTEEKPVKVTTTGDVAEGYVALTPEAVPETVQLRGPSSKIKEIDSVVVETALNGETHDISYTLSPKLLDRDGNVVEGVECFTQHVDVLIKVNKYKKAPVTASYVGVPADGYRVTKIDWTPQNLEIVGNEEDVDGFTSVSLPAVNVAGLTQTNTASFDIRSLDILPENVSIKNGAPNTVTVTVTIEREMQKTLALDVASIGATSGYSYEIVQDGVNITVRGVESLVSGLTVGQIKASVNLRGLAPGEHTLPLSLILPTGVSLVGTAPTVTVNIAAAATSGTGAAEAPADDSGEAQTPATGEAETPATPPASEANPSEESSPADTTENGNQNIDSTAEEAPPNTDTAESTDPSPDSAGTP